MSGTFRIPIPVDVVIWQGTCLHCEARYAVMHPASDEAPRPQTCPFCGHRAVYTRPEMVA